MSTQAVVAEVQNRVEEADRQTVYHQEFQDRYNQWRWWLGGLPILLSATAGLLAALQVPALATALVAFLAAIVGGAHALVQPEKNSNRHGELRAEYADLSRDAKALLIRLSDGQHPSAHRDLEHLNDRMYRLDARAGKYWETKPSH